VFGGFGCVALLFRATSLFNSDWVEGVSTFVPKRQFSGRKKSQLPLIRNGFPDAFQAYDEGSIPFTRSNAFNHLALRTLKVDISLDC
jgi:hypothetical protein